MTTFRLASVPMVHTPGVVKWAAHAGKDGFKVLKAAFPTVPAKGIKKLLAGDYTVDGETVVVTVP